MLHHNNFPSTCTSDKADVARKNNLLLWSKQDDRLHWKHTKLCGALEKYLLQRGLFTLLSANSFRAAFLRTIVTVGGPFK